MVKNNYINEITKNNKNIILLHGDNDYAKKTAFDDILKHYNISKDDISFQAFDQKADSDEIISACNTVSFFGGIKLICVNDFGGLLNEKSNSDNICKYVENYKSTNKLIFMLSSKADKRKKLYKAIKKYGVVLELNTPSIDELYKWVMSEFSKNSRTISKTNALKLIEICGNNMMSLTNEIEKILCYSKSKDVSLDDIEAISFKSLEYNVFKIHEHFLKKDLKSGLSLLNEVMTSEKSPFGIMGLTASKLRTLYKARTLIEAGVKSDVAIKYIGGHPYAAKIALRECKHFSASHLRKSISDVAELDYKLKTGRADMQTSVEKLFLSIYMI